MITVEQGVAEHPHHVTNMQQPETAKNIHVYLNGDKFYPGRKFVVNRRHIADFDGFLNQVTMGIKAPFGAVRHIYTPQSGHRVSELSQLQTGMQVVAGGVERFRKLEYREIGSKRKQKPRRNYLEEDEDASTNQPLFQPMQKIRPNPHKMLVSARWRKYIKDPCQIYVYGNGDINAPALRLLLIPRSMKSWDLVLSEITEKVCNRTGQAVRKLYDMNYRLLTDPSELENGHYYVAVGTEKLKKYPYGDLHSSKTPSPRKIVHHHPLPPIRRRPKPPAREGEENTYSKIYAQRKQRKAHIEETTVMGASAATGYRPLRAKKFKPAKPSTSGSSPDGTTVFPPKPVKVKRMSGVSNATSLEPLPISEDPDGVYKTEAREIKAETVQEDENTKLDLPIDQVRAVEVEEEIIPDVMSARSDDVTTDAQEHHIPIGAVDDVGTSSDLHLDGDSETHPEDVKTPEREQDKESTKEEAVLAAASTALLLADADISVEEKSLVVKTTEEGLLPVEEDLPRVEEDLPSFAVEDTAEMGDQLETSATPAAPLLEDAELDQTESIAKEEEVSMVHAVPESASTPEALPESEVPGKSPTPEPDLAIETEESKVVAKEVTAVTDGENTSEVVAMELTEENEETPLEATGDDEIPAAPEEEPAATERSLTPSSPKPREGEDIRDDAGAEDAAVEETTLPETVADASESPAKEDQPSHEEEEPANENDTFKDISQNEDAPDENPSDKNASNENTPDENPPDENISNENAPDEDASVEPTKDEEAALSVQKDEEDEAPPSVPDESTAPADEAEPFAPAAPDDPAEDDQDTGKNDEDKNSEKGDEDAKEDDPKEPLDSSEPATTARSASGALIGEEDNTVPNTPSTKRSLANGDVTGVSAADVES